TRSIGRDGGGEALSHPPRGARSPRRRAVRCYHRRAGGVTACHALPGVGRVGSVADLPTANGGFLFYRSSLRSDFLLRPDETPAASPEGSRLPAHQRGPITTPPFPLREGGQGVR